MPERIRTLVQKSMPFAFFYRCFTGLCLVWFCLVGASPSFAKTKKQAPPSPPSWGQVQPKAVAALAQRLAHSHQLPLTWVQRQLSQARQLESVLQLMRPAAPDQRKNWAAYRARFVEPRRIAAGLQFWQRHQKAIERASRMYQVPDWLIVGVIGVETLYGQHMGTIPVLDSLTTLSLAFPSAHPRAKERQYFFENELGVFLQLARQEPTLLKAKGSYAGAMGWGQFMPSSIQRFAIDFDGNGHIHLGQSAVDAIGSVAHYFKQHGWQPGLVTHVQANVLSQAQELETLMLPDILPTFNPEQMTQLGVHLAADAPPLKGPLALIELQNGEEPPTYVVGTENFYVVTRYNWSSYYAMAVIELGQTIQAKRQSAQPN